MLGEATSASEETRACPGPAAPPSPGPTSDSWVQSPAHHEKCQTAPADTWPTMASQHLNVLNPGLPSVSRSLLGDKGRACKGGGQRRAEALRGRKGGSSGCSGDTSLPHPQTSLSSPLGGGGCIWKARRPVADVVAVCALSWPESRNWPPPALQGHLGRGGGGAAGPGTGPFLCRKVTWSRASGRKALIHSGCGFSSSPAVSYLLQDSGFPGMPSRKPLCC